MENDIAGIMTLTKDTRSPELDPASQLISAFLKARSGIYRELTELRREVSKPLVQYPSHTTLVM